MEQGTDQEYRLLLQCVRSGAVGSVAVDLYAHDVEAIEWPRLIQFARVHGVLPLVARALDRTESDAVPDDLVQQLRAFTRSVAMHNLRLVHEARQLDEILTEQEVRCIFFKGPLLAIDAYGGLGFRRSGDIDVLVPPDRVEQVEALLLENEFVPFTKIQRLGPLRKRAHLYLTRQLPYRAEKRAPVDLHSDVVGMGYGFTVPFDELYGRSRLVDVGGTGIRTFSAEDMILVLCYQGVNNRWAALKYLSDLVAHIDGHAGLDWDLVIHAAESMGGGRIVRHGLDLAQAVLGYTMPAEVGRWLERDARLESVQRVIREHLNTGLVPPLSFRERMSYYPGVQSTLSGKSRYVLYSIARRLVSPAVD